MFGWTGTLSSEQTAEIAAAKQVVYAGFKSALQAGVPERKARILVDEQFDAAILRLTRIPKLGEDDKGESGIPAVYSETRTHQRRQGEIVLCRACES